MMFEVGKEYEVRMLSGSDEVTMWRTVECYEHPLLKFADIEHAGRGEFLKARVVRGEIVNVTSPNFISAVIHRD